MVSYSFHFNSCAITQPYEEKTDATAAVIADQWLQSHLSPHDITANCFTIDGLRQAERTEKKKKSQTAADNPASVFWSFG